VIRKAVAGDFESLSNGKTFLSNYSTIWYIRLALWAAFQGRSNGCFGYMNNCEAEIMGVINVIFD